MIIIMFFYFHYLLIYFVEIKHAIFIINLNYFIKPIKQISYKQLVLFKLIMMLKYL
jgi:hypothetical protein